MVEAPKSTPPIGPPRSSASDDAWNEILSGDPSGGGGVRPEAGLAGDTASAVDAAQVGPPTPDAGVSPSGRSTDVGIVFPQGPAASDSLGDDEQASSAAERDDDARSTFPQFVMPPRADAVPVVDAKGEANISLRASSDKRGPATSGSVSEGAGLAPKASALVPKVSPFGVVAKSSASSSMSGAAWGGPTPFGPGSSGFMSVSSKGATSPGSESGESSLDSTRSADASSEGATSATPSPDDGVARGLADARARRSEPAIIEAVPAAAIGSRDAAFDTPHSDPIDPLEAEHSPATGQKGIWLVVGALAAAGILWLTISSGSQGEASESPTSELSASLGSANPSEVPGSAAESAESGTGVPSQDTGAGLGAEQGDEGAVAGASDQVEPDKPTAPSAGKKQNKTKQKRVAGKKAASSAKDRPTKAPASGTSSGSASGPDAAALLSEARQASLSGDVAKAYDLAKASYGAKRSASAAQLMAISACKLGHKAKAKAAYAKLGDAKKGAVEKVCRQRGVSLD